MIELAPNHKQGLPLDNPVMIAAGCAGFGSEYRPLLDTAALGAFVTNPLTLAPRKAARTTQALPTTDAVLIHTGLPNPGLRAAVRQYSRQWQRLECPVIVHLAADTPDNMERCVALLEEAHAVSALEIGFRDEEDPALVAHVLQAAIGELPVIVRAPFGRAPEFAELAEQAGAQALTVSAPPRGTLPAPRGKGWLQGRLYSAAHFPLALQQVRALAGQTHLPLIGAGGIYTAAQVQTMLAAGATAVQLDALVWASPAAVNEIASELAG